MSERARSESAGHRARQNSSTRPRRHDLLQVLTAIALLGLSGWSQALIAPPVNALFLHPFAWIAPIWICSRLSTRRAALAGWLVGSCANAAIFSWIVHTITAFTTLPYALGCLALALFALLFGLSSALFGAGVATVRRVSGRTWPLVLPAWFVTCEFAFPQLFPYLQGVAWYSCPQLFLVSTWTGVSGVSYLVIACNCLVVAVLEWTFAPPAQERCASLVACAIIPIAIVIAWGISSSRLHEVDTALAAHHRTLRVAVVQSNITVADEDRLAKRGTEAIADEYVRTSRSLLGNRAREVEVIVWAEGALDASPGYFPALQRWIASTGAELWTGGTGTSRAIDGRPRYHNSAFTLDPRVPNLQRYDKSILLPFGEYIPGESWIPALSQLLPTGRFHPGSGSRVIETSRAHIGFLICYEAILAGYVRETALEHPDLLVNLTYDGWFGDTACPHQHLMLAAIQCAQLGLPMVRAATTGISAVVDPAGRVTARTPVFRRELLLEEVPLIDLPTPYRTFGDLFARLCELLSIVLLFIAWRRRGNDLPRR